LYKIQNKSNFEKKETMKKKFTLMTFASLLSCTAMNAQIVDAGLTHCIRLCSGVVTGAYGEIGNGGNTNSSIPVSISSMSNILAVDANGRHNLVLKNDSTVWAWGQNLEGQLGTGTTNVPGINTPTQVPSLTGIKKLGSGEARSFAIKANGDIWAWGANSQAQLGLGNNTNTYVPTKITSLSGIIDADGGYQHSMFLKNDGTVWTCGNASGGPLGNGVSVGTFSTPVQVLGPGGVGFLTNVTFIAAGYNFSYALKNDGTVWVWGNNANGEFGNGTSNTNTNVPIQITALTGSFIAIDGGADWGIALKSDGTIWTWGRNNDGQLGNSSFVNSLIPVQVTGISTATAIAAGEGHAIAILANGTTWTWGKGANGQLGNGSTAKSNIPVQVNACSITSITEYSNNKNISIYPNPSNGTFTLKCDALQSVTVMSMTGQKVFEKKTTEETQLIDLQFLQSGIYSVMIAGVDGKYSVQKITIQK
jgi:alpha-tubulin suppressor-like RCC1 family protein